MADVCIKSLIGQDEKLHDQAFIQHLSEPLASLLRQYRKTQQVDHSVLKTWALALEVYIIEQFGFQDAYQSLQRSEAKAFLIMQFHHDCVRPAIKKYKIDAIDQSLIASLQALLQDLHDEKAVIDKLQKQPIEDVMQWCAWIYHHQVEPYCQWSVFQLPSKLNFDQLVEADNQNISARSSFDWVGSSKNQIENAKEVSYCLYCHHKDNDACSVGLRAKKAPQSVYENPLGVKLSGCPLGQKISQMHELMSTQNLIAALAVIMIDNPLCVMTGDRICRDCIDACIYQKFDLVDTPSVESHLLQQILSLPYGPEVYLLLLRWNPLRADLFFPKASIDHHVSIIGMGPAGIAMSYYLLMCGVGVYGYEALTLDEGGADVFEPLINRCHLGGIAPKGFGGVMAYGITVRWNKALLDLVWVALKRFSRFHIQGDVRLGGQVSISDFINWGFSHVVLATGAGLPHSLNIEGAYAPGMMHANSFLMHLHLSGELSQRLRQGLSLPIVVIGGGLTAVDAATEAQVYYIRWVMQVCFQVEQLKRNNSYTIWYETLSAREKQQMDTWVAHGLCLQAHQRQQNHKGIAKLIQSWGGVSLVYYKRMQASEAYRSNYQELQHALDQGVIYVESFTSTRILQNEQGVYAVQGMQNERPRTLPAAKVLVAIGTKPNVAYYYENRSEMLLDEGHYSIKEGISAKTKGTLNNVSVIGDLHPRYSGSVVQAIASAKDGYASIIARLPEARAKPLHLQGLTYHVVSRKLIGPGLTEFMLTDAPGLQEGMLFRLTMSYQRQRFHMKGIVVSINDQIKLWVSHHDEPRFLNAQLCGLMGPSGTRLLGESVTRLLVVAGKGYWPWVMAAYQMMKRRGAHFALKCKEPLPPYMSELSEYVDVDLYLQKEDFHVLYCMDATQLKLAHKEHLIKAKGYSAVVDGPMMCMLKGVCAQCVQWQVDEESNRVKTVFACSWPVQPIELIDTEHLAQRQDSNGLSRKLIRLFEHQFG